MKLKENDTLLVYMKLYYDPYTVSWQSWLTKVNLQNSQDSELGQNLAVNKKQKSRFKQ